MSKELILASSSPRRQELLKQVKIPFTLRKQGIDESQINTSDPEEKVKKLAKLKGRYTPILHKDEIILSADTIVSYNHKIFEKPRNKDDAFQMISALSGDKHEVFTGVMIRSSDDEIIFIERTTVEFWPLSTEEIYWYTSTNEPYDKAGAYGIQSLGAMLVKQIIGDYYNAVGLPISRVVRELKQFGVYPKE
ncbi:septum formation protein Maf [Oceanobacillus arenosus]|uniref:dTTP/UTP pyrophosphatase n=1 Tax=Oceanobacillus arenosus TaxID=1229153 RepID=A0A3D8PTK4_9BACI|nr:Maf family protein [Oceanobacillus arenosus]RDW18295.1 septum formation protein Maf [Oceanobacillus arenosus]